MMKSDFRKINGKRSRWWHLNAERIGWTATLLVIALLLVGTVWLTPELREEVWPASTQTGQNDSDTSLTDGNMTSDGQSEPNDGQTPEDGASSPADAVAVSGGSVSGVDTGKDTETDGNNAGESTGGSTPEFSLPMLSSEVEIIRTYGYGYNPNTEDFRFHRGYDIAANENSEVYAFAAGTVVEEYEDAYWGGVIVIDHGGGWKTIYRCVFPTVTAGAQVAAGDMYKC